MLAGSGLNTPWANPRTEAVFGTCVWAIVGAVHVSAVIARPAIVPTAPDPNQPNIE